MAVLTRTLTALTAAAILALATPLAAHADPAPYPPAKPDTWARTVRAGTAVIHEVPEDTFTRMARLRLSVSGTSAPPTSESVNGVQPPATLLSDDEGGATITLAFSATTRGVYDVTLTQPGTDRSSYGVITVLGDPADPAVAADPGSDPGVTAVADPGATALPHTGTRIDAGVVWTAGGVAAAGAALVIGVPLRRRLRADRAHRD